MCECEKLNNVIVEKHKTMESLEKEITDLRNTITNQDVVISELTADVESYKRTMGDLKNKITNRETIIDELRKKLKDKEDLIDSLKKGAEEKNKCMKEMYDTIERLNEWKVDLTHTNHDLVDTINKKEAELECFRLNFDPDLEAYKKENLAFKEELEHIKNQRVCVAPPCAEDAIEELHHKLSNLPGIRWHIEYDVDELTYYIEIKKVYK